MKFVISTQELNTIINKIQNVVPLKATINILNYFLIDACNDEIVLTATDLTVGIRCNTEVKILEEGTTILPAKKLSQLVRELTTTQVEFSTNNHDITTIISGTSRFKLKGLNKNEYPALPDLSDGQNFTIPQKDLKDLLYRTAFAVSREDNRYVLTGVLMSITDSVVQFTGTDGKRLARSHQSIDVAPTFKNQSIIPIKAVEEILKNLTDAGDAKIIIMPDRIGVVIQQTLLLTKLLVGDFPDIQRVIPEHSDFIISLHREELISLLRQLLLFTVDSNHSVRFTFTTGQMSLTANTSDVGEGFVSMPVNYDGEKLEIAFNPGFFIDILRHCKEETVTIGLTDAYNPGLLIDGQPISSLSHASPLFVIMPMRLSED